jgi:hypothetical protein
MKHLEAEMSVLHDYYCTKHGIFEAREAKCPMKHCEGEISLVFLKPVGLKSDSTKQADTTLAGLAKDFGMTDIKSTREGEHQTGYLTRNNIETPADRAKREAEESQNRPGQNAIWGDAGMRGLNMSSIIAGRAVQSVRGESVGINPKDAGVTHGPRASVVMNDHENLQIK